MLRFLRKLLTNEGGQDLVEYALAATFVGLIVIAAFSSLQSAFANAYSAYTNSTNNNWQMPDPAGGS